MEAAVDTFEAHLQRLTLTPLEALKDPKTKAQLKKCLAPVASALLGTNDTNVAIAGTGITFGIPSDGGDDSDTPVEEAASLVERMIDMQGSVRQLYKLPRTCLRADLDKARRHMRPYTAHPIAVFGNAMSQRAAAAVPLWDVVSTQVALAQQCQMPPPTDTKIKVIVAPDATPLWRTSATRCDVYVHVWGTPSRASDVRRWATWWALDGPDDGRCLRAVDRLAGLDREVEDLEQDRDIMWGGTRYTFEVFVTGDGKLMLVSNTGDKCWCCGNVGSMVPTDFVDALCRWGSFLTSVPLRRRIGDNNHCACRVLNAILTQVGWMVEDWVAADHSKRGAVKELQQLHQHVQAEAEAIPPAERLQQKQTKDGTFSLTSSALFWRNHQTPDKLVVILCSHFECEVVGERGMRAHVLIKLLLRAFRRYVQSVEGKGVPHPHSSCPSSGTCPSVWRVLECLGVQAHNVGPLGRVSQWQIFGDV